MTRLLVLAWCVLLACSGCGGSSDVAVVAGSEGSSGSMAQLVVEVHFPLTPTPGLAEDAYPFPWIMEVQDRVAVLDLEADGAEEYDDGEELGGTYAFFLTGDDERAVLSAAKKIATAPDVPAGAFVIVNDSDGDMGEGKRLALSAIR